MENNELFKTIERLKETLTEISSARQQVTETVDAYAQTRSKIQSYTDSLRGIEDVINQLVTLLQNRKETLEQQSSASVLALETSCNVVANATKEKLTSASQKFSSDTLSNINLMTKQIDRFAQAVKEARELTDKVDATSNEVSRLVSSIEVLQQKLVSSQDAQDRVIDKISQTQDNEVGSLQTLSNTADNITTSISSLNNILTQHGDHMQSLAAKSDSIAADIARVNQQCAGIQDTVNTSKAKVLSSIDEVKGSQQNLQKEIRYNRYISIVLLIGMILIAVLSFMAK